MGQSKGHQGKLRPEQSQPEPGKEILDWFDLIPEDQWSVYREAIAAVQKTGAQFMLGGGFGLAAYTGQWRNTKDIDLYVLPQSVPLLAKALATAGFSDYYEQLPYDRGWIYRSYRQGVIVDLIWSMANRRAEVQPDWVQHAKLIRLRGESLQVLAPEELLWCKLYVFQRDHCDWPDVLNLLYATGPSLDWPRLCQRLGEDSPVLKSVLTLFNWISPNRAGQIPADVRRQFQLAEPAAVSPEEERRRVRLLDTRAWFAPFQPKDLPLEV